MVQTLDLKRAKAPASIAPTLAVKSPRVVSRSLPVQRSDGGRASSLKGDRGLVDRIARQETKYEERKVTNHKLAAR
jgi:hypothetical protein